MHTKLKFLTALVTLAALALFTIPVKADVGTVNFITAGTLTNSAARSTGFSDVKIDDNEIVGLQLNMQGDQAGTSDVLLMFARSKDGSTFETTPRFTWSAAVNGNTAVVAYTNITALTGGAHSLRLIYATNANASAVCTNVTISVVKKRPSVR